MTRGGGGMDSTKTKWYHIRGGVEGGGGGGWYWDWDWSKMTRVTEDTDMEFRRLEERLHTGYVVEEFLIKQLQKKEILPTTASSIEGVQVEEDKIEKVTIIWEVLRHSLGY